MAKLKTSIIYGLVVALSGSVLLLSLIGLKLIGPEAITLDTEMTGGTILFLMLYLFLLFAIYFAIKKRKESLGQTITFKEAVIQGFTVSLSTAVFSVVFTFIFYELLYPTYLTETLEALKQKMESIGVPAEKLSAKLAEKREYYSTSTQSFFSFTAT